MTAAGRTVPTTPRTIADAIESIVYSSGSSVEIALRLGWLCRTLRGEPTKSQEPKE